MKKTRLGLVSVLLGILLVGNIQAMEFDTLGGVDIHGFISQGYLKSTDNNFFADTKKGTTQFNEAGINFSTDVTERLRIGLQILAYDLGDIGNNTLTLDWAVADYHWRDWLGLRIGNLKMMHGLYNETRDIDMLRTSIFLPQSVYNESWRESTSSIQGAGIYGEIPAGFLGSFSYGGQYGSLNMPKDGGAAKLAEDQWPLKTRDISVITTSIAAQLPTLETALTGLETIGAVTPTEHSTITAQLNTVVGDTSASANFIDIATVDVEDIDVEYAYTGKLYWTTPLEGLVVGASTWRYDFEARTSAYLDTEALQALSTIGALTPDSTTGLTPFQSSAAAAQAAFAASGEAYDAHVAFEPAMAYFDSAASANSNSELGVTLPTFPTYFNADATTVTYSAEYTYKNLVLSGEYMATRYKINFESDLFLNPDFQALLPYLANPQAATFEGRRMNINTFTAAGWYGMANYRFTYWFELGAYYSEYYPDIDDKDGTKRVTIKKLDNELHRGFLKDICVTTRFDINENWVLKLEGHMMRGAASMLGADNPAPTIAYPLDGSERYDKNWFLGAGKITYSF